MTDRRLAPSQERVRDERRGVYSRNHWTSAKRPATPRPIDGAQWQAGVTPNNDEYRVLLDGRPVPLAFAASDKDGWVLAYAEPIDRNPFDCARIFRIPRSSAQENPAGSDADFQRMTGDVRIVRGN